MKAVTFIPAHFGANDRILINGGEYRHFDTSDHFYHFYNVEHRDRTERIKLDDLDRLIDKPKKFRIDRDYYSIANIELRSNKAIGFTYLSPQQMAEVEHRKALIDAFDEMLKVISDEVDDREQKALDSVWDALVDRFLRSKQPSALCMREKISVQTINLWKKRLRAYDGKIESLEDFRWQNSGNQTPRHSEEAEELIAIGIDQYLQEGKPTIAKVYQELKDAFFKKNQLRVAAGLPELRCPTLKSFTKRIGRISRFVKHALRMGLDSAHKAFRSSHGGIGFLRPGQRVEVDGWVCHLHTLVKDTELWSQLPPAIRDRIKDIRITIIVAIDVATRSILALNFTPTENADAAIAALRMSLEDKRKVAEAFGCTAPWPQYGWGNWVHDRGAAYAAKATVGKVLMGMGTDQATVPGVPWLRGVIERFFRTVGDQLLSYFLGQTGSNMISRTDFQTAAYASVTLDELTEKMVQWVVDVYHRTAHRSLGITPLQAWHRLSKLYPPPPRHGPVKLLDMFGITIRRKLSGKGLCIANAQFNSNNLQIYRRLLGNKDDQFIDVRIDPENLGQVLVKIEDRYVEKLSDGMDGWMIVEGPEELSQVSLQQISLADREMELRFGIDQATSDERAREVRSAIKQFGDQVARQRLSQKPPTLEMVNKRLEQTFHYALGDTEFRDELAKLHAPVELATGATSPITKPKKSRAIKAFFEDNK